MTIVVHHHWVKHDLTLGAAYKDGGIFHAYISEDEMTSRGRHLDGIVAVGISHSSYSFVIASYRDPRKRFAVAVYYLSEYQAMPILCILCLCCTCDSDELTYLLKLERLSAKYLLESVIHT